MFDERESQHFIHTVRKYLPQLRHQLNMLHSMHGDTLSIGVVEKLYQELCINPGIFRAYGGETFRLIQEILKTDNIMLPLFTSVQVLLGRVNTPMLATERTSSPANFMNRQHPPRHSPSLNEVLNCSPLTEADLRNLIDDPDVEVGASTPPSDFEMVRKKLQAVSRMRQKSQDLQPRQGDRWMAWDGTNPAGSYPGRMPASSGQQGFHPLAANHPPGFNAMPQTPAVPEERLALKYTRRRMSRADVNEPPSAGLQGDMMRPGTPGGMMRPATPGGMMRPATPGGMMRPGTPGGMLRPGTPGPGTANVGGIMPGTPSGMLPGMRPGTPANMRPGTPGPMLAAAPSGQLPGTPGVIRRNDPRIQPGRSTVYQGQDGPDRSSHAPHHNDRQHRSFDSHSNSRSFSHERPGGTNNNSGTSAQSLSKAKADKWRNAFLSTASASKEAKTQFRRRSHSTDKPPEHPTNRAQSKDRERRELPLPSKAPVVSSLDKVYRSSDFSQFQKLTTSFSKFKIPKKTSNDSEGKSKTDQEGSKDESNTGKKDEKGESKKKEKGEGESNKKEKGEGESKNKEKSEGESKKKEREESGSKKKHKEQGESNKKDKEQGESNKKDKEQSESKKKDKEQGESKKKDKEQGESKNKEKEKGDTKQKEKEGGATKPKEKEESNSKKKEKEESGSKKKEKAEEKKQKKGEAREDKKESATRKEKKDSTSEDEKKNEDREEETKVSPSEKSTSKGIERRSSENAMYDSPESPASIPITETVVEPKLHFPRKGSATLARRKSLPAMVVAAMQEHESPSGRQTPHKYAKEVGSRSLRNIFEKTDDNCQLSTQNIINCPRRTRTTKNFNEVAMMNRLFKQNVDASRPGSALNGKSVSAENISKLPEAEEAKESRDECLSATEGPSKDTPSEEPTVKGKRKGASLSNTVPSEETESKDTRIEEPTCKDTSSKDNPCTKSLAMDNKSTESISKDNKSTESLSKDNKSTQSLSKDNKSEKSSARYTKEDFLNVFAKDSHIEDMIRALVTNDDLCKELKEYFNSKSSQATQDDERSEQTPVAPKKRGPRGRPKRAVCEVASSIDEVVSSQPRDEAQGEGLLCVEKDDMHTATETAESLNKSMESHSSSLVPLDSPEAATEGRVTRMRKRRRNELDLLNEDINEMFIKDDVNAIGRGGSKRNTPSLMKSRKSMSDALRKTPATPSSRQSRAAPAASPVTTKRGNSKAKAKLNRSLPARTGASKLMEDYALRTLHDENNDEDDEELTNLENQMNPVANEDSTATNIHSASNDDNGVGDSDEDVSIGGDNVDDDNDSEQLIKSEPADEVIRNNNSEWHCQSQFMRTCVVCHQDIGSEPIGHYCEEHGENYVSRLPPDTLSQVGQGSLCRPSHGYHRGKHRVWVHQCQFCLESRNATAAGWLKHFTTHTGESVIGCSNCAATPKSKKLGCDECPSAQLKGQGPNVYTIEIHVCHLCSFMQFNQNNLKIHYNTQHPQERAAAAQASYGYTVTLLETAAELIGGKEEADTVSQVAKTCKKEVGSPGRREVVAQSDSPKVKRPRLKSEKPSEAGDLDESNIGESPDETQQTIEEVSVQEDIIETPSTSAKTAKKKDTENIRKKSKASITRDAEGDTETLSQPNSVEGTRPNESDTVQTETTRDETDDNNVPRDENASVTIEDSHSVKDNAKLPKGNKKTKSQQAQANGSVPMRDSSLNSVNEKESRRCRADSVALALEDRADSVALALEDRADSVALALEDRTDSVALALEEKLPSCLGEDPATVEEPVKDTGEKSDITNVSHAQKEFDIDPTAECSESVDPISIDTVEARRTSGDSHSDSEPKTSSDGIILVDLTLPNTNEVPQNPSYSENMDSQRSEMMTFRPSVIKIQTKEELVTIHTNTPASTSPQTSKATKRPTQEAHSHVDLTEDSSSETGPATTTETQPQTVISTAPAMTTATDDDDDWEDVEVVEPASRRPASRSSKLLANLKAKNRDIYNKYNSLKSKRTLCNRSGGGRSSRGTALGSLRDQHSNSNSCDSYTTTSSQVAEPPATTTNGNSPDAMAPSAKATLGNLNDFMPDSPCCDLIDLNPELASLQSLQDLNDISSILNSNDLSAPTRAHFNIDAPSDSNDRNANMQEALDFIRYDQQQQQQQQQHHHHQPQRQLQQPQTQELPLKHIFAGMPLPSARIFSIMNVGYSKTKGCLKFYCLCKNCSFLFSSEAIGLESHFETDHPTIGWNGYCRACKSLLVPTEGDNLLSIKAEIQHMMNVHADPVQAEQSPPKRVDAQQSAHLVNHSGPVQAAQETTTSTKTAEKPRIMVRVLPGDCLSRKTPQNVPDDTPKASGDLTLYELLTAEQRPITKPPLSYSIADPPMLLGQDIINNVIETDEPIYTNVSNEFAITSVTSVGPLEMAVPQPAPLRPVLPQPTAIVTNIPSDCPLQISNVMSLGGGAFDIEPRPRLDGFQPVLPQSSARPEDTTAQQCDHKGRPFQLNNASSATRAFDDQRDDSLRSKHTASKHTTTSNIRTQHRDNDSPPPEIVAEAVPISKSLTGDFVITQSLVTDYSRRNSAVKSFNIEIASTAATPEPPPGPAPASQTTESRQTPTSEASTKDVASSPSVAERVSPDALANTTEGLALGSAENISSLEGMSTSDRLTEKIRMILRAKYGESPAAAPKEVDSSASSSQPTTTTTPKPSTRDEPQKEELLLATIENLIGNTGVPACKLYTCLMEDCKAVLNSLTFCTHLQEHLKAMDPAAAAQFPSKCPHCQTIFRRAGDLKQHLVSHLRHHYFCFVCYESGASLKQCSRHYNKAHWTAPQLYHDVFCTFPESGGMQSKYYVVHSTPLSEAELQDFGQRLIVYYQRKKAGNKTYFKSNEADLLPLQPIFAEIVHCAECDYKTKVRSNMTRHLQAHKSPSSKMAHVDPVNPVPCLNTAERHFDKMTNLASSSLVPAGSAVPSKGAAKIEYAFVEEAQLYVCGVAGCEHLTSTEDLFRAHLVALHRNVMTGYTCPFCKEEVCKRGVSVERISVHLKYHGKVLYQCEECQWLHYHKPMAARHVNEKHSTGQVNILQHKREAPGETDGSITKTLIIGEKFRESSTAGGSAATTTSVPLLPYPALPASAPSSGRTSILIAPLSQAKLYFECTHCKHQTVRMEQMLKHCSEQHSVSLYQCPYCDYTTRYPSRVVHHQKLKHPNSEPSVQNNFRKVDTLWPVPLWQRDDPNRKFRQIRGILIENEEEAALNQNQMLRKEEEEGLREEEAASSDGSKDEGAKNGNTEKEAAKKRPREAATTAQGEKAKKACRPEAEDVAAPPLLFSCSDCGYATANWPDLSEEHWPCPAKGINNTELQESPAPGASDRQLFTFGLQNMFKCPVCLDFSGLHGQVKVHIAEDHSDCEIPVLADPSSSKAAGPICGHCDYEATDLTDLQEHYLTAEHQETDLKHFTKERLNELSEQVGPLTQPFYYCSRCLRIEVQDTGHVCHNNETAASRCKEIEAGDILYTCGRCKDVFKDPKPTMEHMIEHYEGFKACMFCRKDQANLSNYIRHIYNEHRVKFSGFCTYYPFQEIMRHLEGIQVLFHNGLKLTLRNLAATSYNHRDIMRDVYEAIRQKSLQPPIPTLKISRMAEAKNSSTFAIASEMPKKISKRRQTVAVTENIGETFAIPPKRPKEAESPYPMFTPPLRVKRGERKASLPKIWPKLDPPEALVAKTSVDMNVQVGSKKWSPRVMLAKCDMSKYTQSADGARGGDHSSESSQQQERACPASRKKQGKTGNTK